MAVISLEDFKKLATWEVEIPGFQATSDPITVRIKSTGIMNLLANGRIPNQLMGQVTELFGEGEVTKDNISGMVSEDSKKAAMKKMTEGDDTMKSMATLMKIFAENALVEPTYQEIGDMLTDEQLTEIFGHTMGGVTELEPFHEEQGTK